MEWVYLSMIFRRARFYLGRRLLRLIVSRGRLMGRVLSLLAIWLLASAAGRSARTNLFACSSQSVGSFLQIAWSPDGKRIASGNFEGKVCFWTAATNKCDGLIKAHQNAVFSLVWSADGDQLATGGGIIRIWDTKTGKLVKSFGLNDDFHLHSFGMA